MELKAAGFSAKQLKAAGFSALEILDGGFPAKQLKAAGFSAEELWKTGICIFQKAKGKVFDVRVLSIHSWVRIQLRKYQSENSILYTRRHRLHGFVRIPMELKMVLLSCGLTQNTT